MTASDAQAEWPARVAVAGGAGPPLPRALIFDVDGTLAETEEIHRRAFNEAFAAHGLDWSWDRALYRRLLDVTGGKERIRHFIDTRSPPGGQAMLPRIAALHEDKTRRYAALVRGGAMGLRPGVWRLVEEARAAGVRLAIATTTSLPNIEALLAATFGPHGLNYFSVIGAGDVVAHKKPAPDIYFWVLDRLGIAPAEAVAFEDSANGLAAALAAGIPTIVTPGLYTDDQQFPGALAVLGDLGEPGARYRHLGGEGAGEGMVTLALLGRWLGRIGAAGTTAAGSPHG